ncbi:MAG: hypothetical protein VX498_06760 [Myxococcota bacterium]|nr:hypothetical protein [Myxococcota bacterium]
MEDRPHPLRDFSRKWGPWLAGASCVALLLIWNSSAPSTVLISGTEYVEGATRVQAGPLLVDVEGRALIRVEQPAQAPQEPALGELSLYQVRKTLTGSVVEVSVYRGTAVVQTEEGQRIALGPGEQRRFPPRPVTPE